MKMKQAKQGEHRYIGIPEKEQQRNWQDDREWFHLMN
jgi:hypothetical protein